MGDISPELVKRMVALVRGMVESSNEDRHVAKRGYVGDYNEAHAIAKLLPEPERTDPDILTVREILHANQRAMTPPPSGWGNMSYRAGSYDDLGSFKAALAAYKGSSAGGAA